MVTLNSHERAMSTDERLDQYWQSNKKVLYVLLSIGSIITFSGSLFYSWLIELNIFGISISTLITEQTVMVFYVLLILTYSICMKLIKDRLGFITDNPVKLSKQRLFEQNNMSNEKPVS